MTKFLRFEVGGASALLWMLLFLSPYLNIGTLIQVDAMKLFAVIFGSITLSIPLGNFIHQFTDSLFNPFARRRLGIWPRAVTKYIDEQLRDSPVKLQDTLYQAVLVFSKSHSRVTKTTNAKKAEPTDGRVQETTVELKIEVLREEISNRYSYYYARLENGAVSPILGWLSAALVVHLFGATQYITAYPAFPPMWMVIVAIAGAFPVLWRIPQLFRELDDLEVALVALQRDSWPTRRD